MDVAFDTETKGLDWFDENQRAFLATWSTDSGDYICHKGDQDEEDLFFSALESADRIICHNFAFDYHQVKATWGFDIFTDTEAGRTGEVYDTDLMARVVRPDLIRYGLKPLADLFIGPESSEGEEAIKKAAQRAGIKLKDVGGYYDVWRAAPELLERYALLDSNYTLKLFRLFEEEGAKDAKTQAALDLERRVLPIIVRAEHIGVHLDKQAVKELDDEYTAQAQKSRDFLATELGDDALDSPQGGALTEALLSNGVPLTERTKEGALATNKFALQKFEDDYPIIAELQDWRTADKFLASYIGPMRQRDDVHASFRQIGARTHRMSCTRPNMQNFPKRAGKEVRRMFIPRPGNVFVVADYDSIEMRLLAHYLNDDGFKELIESGHDPHAFMASQIYGGVMEDYLKVEDGGTEDGDKKRSIAKNTLFAIVYGAGGPRVSNMNKIPLDEARSLISSIKATLPNYRRLTERVKKKVKMEGHIRTIHGRRLAVPKDKGYVGLNYLIQGSAAEIMKKGLINIEDFLADAGLENANTVLVVHDEAVVEVARQDAERAQPLIDAAMTAAYDLRPHLKVTSNIVETNYADA